MAAPSILQHKVKTVAHYILQKILEENFHAEPHDLRSTCMYSMCSISMCVYIKPSLMWIVFGLMKVVNRIVL